MTRSQGIARIYAVDERGDYVPSDVTFCTLSVSRKTGGEIKTLKAHVPTGSMVHLQRNRMINLVPKEDRGQRRGTEHHVHLALLIAVNGEYFNDGTQR